MPQPPKRRRGSRIYLRNGVWWIYHSPTRERWSLDTRDKAEAERRFGAALAGARGGDAGRPTEKALSDIASEFLDAPHGYTRRTRQTYRERLTATLKRFKVLGAEYPSDLTHATLDRWIDARIDEVSRATINRDLRALRVCLRWAVARGLCPACPTVTERAELREPVRPQRHVVPGPAEIRAILAKLEHVGARVAVRALYATGVRIQELLRLRVGDLERGRLYVRPEEGSASKAEPTKGYRERVIPLGEPAQEAVLAWLAWCAEHGVPGSTYWLRYRLHLACTAAGVEPCGFHDLRRAFATEAARAGIDLVVIARWLGHRLVATTEKYLAEYREDRHVAAHSRAGSKPTGLYTTCTQPGSIRVNPSRHALHQALRQKEGSRAENSYGSTVESNHPTAGLPRAHRF